MEQLEKENLWQQGPEEERNEHKQTEEKGWQQPRPQQRIQERVRKEEDDALAMVSLRAPLGLCMYLEQIYCCNSVIPRRAQHDSRNVCQR